jgi:hypothetical protein
MPVATDVDLDNGSTNRSTDGGDNGLQALDHPTVRRSVQIQENAQRQGETLLPDVHRPGRFEIVPPSLTDEQRREYVKYEEDDKGNLV